MSDPSARRPRETRIAIVGAGLAGLACAHELERHGYAADIYEQRHRIGKMFQVVEIMFQPLIMDPMTNIYEHLRQELHLPVNPANTVTLAVIHTRNRQAEIAGRLGYTTIRGDDERALEAQLARHVRSPIRFGESPDVEVLRDRYDLVFVADGTPRWAKHFGVWKTDVSWWIRGAVVKGDYNPAELHFFFNTRYAQTGYAMISPFDERTAAVGVGLPDSGAQAAEECWERFARDQGRFWEEEVRQFKLEEYEMGTVSRRRIGNVILIGNSGGFIEPLGITGQMSALRSAVYAVRQTLGLDDSFSRFCSQWDTYHQRLLRLRSLVNTWTDDHMDRVAGLVDHGIGTVLSHVPWNLLDPAGALLQLWPGGRDHNSEPGQQHRE